MLACTLAQTKNTQKINISKSINLNEMKMKKNWLKEKKKKIQIMV